MIWLTIALLSLLVGHFIKVFRWGLFIKLYEKPNVGVLLQSLSIAHAINFIIPFHVGDIYRIWYSGKRMSNGIKFSLATIIVEHFIDLIVLVLICVILFFMGHNTIGTMVLVTAVAATVVLLPIVTMRWDRRTKYIVIKFAKIFNPKIELKILGVVWAFVTIFKHLIFDISKTKIAISTLTMWFFYLSSYWFMAESLQSLGMNVRLRNVLDIFFNSSSIITHETPSKLAIYWGVYVLTPLLIIYITTLFYGKKQWTENKATSIIPHVNSNDALAFLETFFRGNLGGAFLKGFLEVNKDVSILEDYSAGSNAVTLLCTDGKKTFFRKFAIGKDGEKLYQQMGWIKTYENQIPLPTIESFKKEKDYCSYDMPYNDSAVNFFKFIHTRTPEDSWKKLKSILDDLRNHLYRFDEKAPSSLVNEYYEEKVAKNLQKIKNSPVLSSILQYDDIYINGIKFKNLKCLETIFDKTHLAAIFSDSPICRIHGDLTVENIICYNGSYYLIDPNIGNILESPYMDFAKLFQSLHGGYEFLMRIQNVSVSGNHIDYTYVRSSAYDFLYRNLCDYIIQEFGEDALQQITYHELIHWLRLMPYKIKKGTNALVFYAGFVKLVNEIALKPCLNYN